MSTPEHKRYPQQELRKPLRPGERTCLYCGKLFMSWDKTLNRICGGRYCGKDTIGIMDDASVSSIPRSGR